jgi:CrcB protein
VWLALGPGFCGAFTTWSTLGYETLRLYADGARGLALANVVVSLALGLSAASVGYLLGSLV